MDRAQMHMRRLALGEEVVRAYLAMNGDAADDARLHDAGEHAIAALLVYDIAREGCDVSRRLGQLAGAAVWEATRSLERIAARPSALRESEEALREFATTLLITLGQDSLDEAGLSELYLDRGGRLAGSYAVLRRERERTEAERSATAAPRAAWLLDGISSASAKVGGAVLAFLACREREPSTRVLSATAARGSALALATRATPGDRAWPDYLGTIIETFAGHVAIALAGAYDERWPGMATPGQLGPMDEPR
jgi:hypothetical protein